MSKASVALTIEKLAGLGDGMAMHQGHKVFVPYTLAGDKVRVRITRKTADADYAVLEEIIAPSPERVNAVCKHFGTCGGCALQHLNAEAYKNFKQQMAQEAVRKAGYPLSVVEPLVLIAPGSRRRVELNIEDGQVGFFAEGSHDLVDIEECKVLEPALFALVMELKQCLAKLPSIYSVQINGLNDGYDLLMAQAENVPCQLPQLSGAVRAVLRVGETKRLLWQTKPAVVTLSGVEVEVPPGAFLQASRQAQDLMVERVLTLVGDAPRVLDLFAGIGTYSFPLAAKSEVTAVEGEGKMVSAMHAAARVAKLETRLKPVRRDLFTLPFTPGELKNFDVVVINPPRTGAKAQCEELARAKVKKIVMVSCNPATFTRDARLLKAAGYSLKNLLPIDQFVYSAHLELVAEFCLDR